MPLPKVVREPPINPFCRVSPLHRLAAVPPDDNIHTDSVPANAPVMHAISPATLSASPPNSFNGSTNGYVIPTVGLSSRSEWPEFFSHVLTSAPCWTHSPLAGAGCSRTSTYVNSPARPTKHQMKNVMCSLSCRLLTTLIELVKIQQQKQQQQRTPAHDVTRRQQRSSSNGHTLPACAVTQQMYHVGGTRGLYHRLSATILCNIGGYRLYFFGVRPVSFLFPFPTHKYPP